TNIPSFVFKIQSYRIIVMWKWISKVYLIVIIDNSVPILVYVSNIPGQGIGQLGFRSIDFGLVLKIAVAFVPIIIIDRNPPVPNFIIIILKNQGIRYGISRF